MFIANAIKCGETLRKSGRMKISVKPSEEISHLRKEAGWNGRF